MSEYTFNVNGAIIDASFKEEDIENVYIPLLKEWEDLQKKENRRIVVFIAAPPGCGKTTMTYFFESLSKQYCSNHVQALGIDGFHFPQEYLQNHYIMLEGKRTRLIDIKGHPKTFDVKKLEDYIIDALQKNVMWPYYSRKLHDVVENAIKVDSDILLLEGNYLLYKELPWSNLKQYASSTLFVNMDKDILVGRLINRKIMTGRSEEEAEEFVRYSDSRNIDLVINNSSVPDHTILFNQNNEIIEFK